ncbi:hypothetical protein RDABS01_033406 [Bienertia sinuspersici]
MKFDFALLDISNIKKLIPLVLDPKKGEYSCWSTLFHNAARAYNVLHHIDTTIPTPSDIDTSLWAQVDAVVLSWIYATISTDLLVAILNDKSTAMDTWTRLRDLFQRNNDNSHQNNLSMALYSSQPQSLNLLSNYVEQQPMPPRQKRKLNIDLNEDLNEDDESENMDLSSGLPDDVLVYLLSLVDMKTAGRTSVLSKSWRHAWTRLMDLDFDSPETTAIALSLTDTCSTQPKMDNYVKWVNQVISANKAPYLNTFRLHFPLNNFYAADIENWLKFSFNKEVRNLEINLLASSLRIQLCNIFSFNPAFVVNATLETLLLKSVSIDEPLLEWILSNCLNLQHLSLRLCKIWSDASSKHQKFVVSSLKLKHLEIIYCFGSINLERLQLFAPNLTSFVFFESKTNVEYCNIKSLVDAAFGGSYCRHIFQNLDILYSFSSQLVKLSVEWREVRMVSSGFPTFDNVKLLEIIFHYEDDSLSFTSLVEACPLLHTFKLQFSPSYNRLIDDCPNSAPKDAQVDAIRSHKHLQAVEYVGYGGCTGGYKLALFLTQHASMLNKFVFDPNPTLFATTYKDQLASRRHAELLAKRIRGSLMW